MNIQPQFLNSPQFRRFKKRIGSFAMEHIVVLGCRCQQTKSPVIEITDAEDLEFMLNIESGGQEILDTLVASGLVDPEGGNYTCTFFIEMNAQLISNWENGKARAKRIKEAQSKPTESKSKEINSSQSNSTQRYAQAVPKQCSSNAQSKPTESKVEDPTEGGFYGPDGKPVF
jgi:hypothetical protein